MGLGERETGRLGDWEIWREGEKRFERERDLT